MEKSFRLFSCLGFLSLTLTGCGAGGGSTEPPIDPPIHEHTWAHPTYTWSDDYSSCTAERVCEIDNTHKESETSNSTYEIIIQPTEESEGAGRYTATFTNTAFLTQTKDVVIDKIDPNAPVVDLDNMTVTYGLYPQTVLEDKNGIYDALNALTTPESNGWYLYNNEYYAKTTANPYDTDYVFDNGTTIVSGTTYWFKCEPITWNILSNNDGEYYLLSSALLDAHRYNASWSGTDENGRYANNYEYSEIRSWLNDDFYNSAFALGNEYIQTTTVHNSASTTDSSSNSYACSNTNDKVFLPSYQDYINSSYGFSTSTLWTKTRECKTTDWARSRGAYYIRNNSYLYNGYYWTRSPGSDRSYYAWNARYDGTLDTIYVYLAYYSVRPGLSIKVA